VGWGVGGKKPITKKRKKTGDRRGGRLILGSYPGNTRCRAPNTGPKKGKGNSQPLGAEKERKGEKKKSSSTKNKGQKSLKQKKKDKSIEQFNGWG